jgi:hypothetical protein
MLLIFLFLVMWLIKEGPFGIKKFLGSSLFNSLVALLVFCCLKRSGADFGTCHVGLLEKRVNVPGLRKMQTRRKLRSLNAKRVALRTKVSI